MAATKEPPTIFVMVDSDDKYHGCFKSVEDVERYCERENVEEGYIFEIVRAEEFSYPPEPMMEFSDRKLSSFL